MDRTNAERQKRWREKHKGEVPALRRRIVQLEKKLVDAYSKIQRLRPLTHDEMNTLYAQHSPERSRVVAIHEAGHAVMAVSHRRGVQRVTIKRRGNIHGQCFMTQRKERDAASARIAALVDLAGWAAERVHVPDQEPFGYDRDFENANKLSRRWKLDSFSTLQSEATAILQRPENQRAVLAVAQALIEQETVSGHEVAGLITKACHP